VSIMTKRPAHLTRRSCITLCSVGIAMIAGCQSQPVPVSSSEQPGNNTRGDNEIGLSETRADLEVVVNEARTIDQLEFELNSTDNETLAAPETGDLYIAEVEVTNNDIESRVGPGFLVQDYQQTELEDYQSNELRNDVLFYSGDEKGAANLPEVAEMTLYDGLIADGEELTAYPPTSVGGPEIDAGETLSGWVFGIVESDADARLMVHWDGESSFWAVEES